MKLRALVLGVGLTFLSLTSPASASLTSSEKAQVRDYFAGARAENAQRVRALVARTDLGVDESTGVLKDAVTAVPFTMERGVFLRELAFGVSSAPSRPLLVAVVTKSLLARADAIHAKFSGGLDHEKAAIAELLAIYGWLDTEIANAGKPTAGAHDASAGVTAAAYEECSRALREHVEAQAKVLKGDGIVPETLGRVRAQAQVALLDMLPDGVTRRVDAADRLGLKGARRHMLADWGVLLADGGKLDEPKAERVRTTLARLPGARVDLEVLFAGDDKGPIKARGVVAFAGSNAAGSDAYPFGDEVQAGTYDAPTSAITQDLAVLAVKRAFENHGELRLQAERDAAAAFIGEKGKEGKVLGRPRAPSVDAVVGAAAHLLLTDAPRAVDLAMLRAIDGKTESAALLSDAIAALVAFDDPAKKDAAAKGPGPSLELGKGATEKATMTAIKLAPNGVATGFTLDGHVWQVERVAPSYAVVGAKRDGQPLSAAALPTAKPPKKK